MHGAYPLLNFIPMSSLAGVMIVVVLHTFKWFSVPMVVSALLPRSLRKSLRLPEDVDRWDMYITAVVTIVVVTVNLVYAIGVGLVMAAVRYAWESSQELVVIKGHVNGVKTYVVQGKLSFATAMRFQTVFDYENDPEKVELIFDSMPGDYSASQSLNKVLSLYKKNNKEVNVSFGTPALSKVVDVEGTDDMAASEVASPEQGKSQSKEVS
jgi:SulP family sulfate permease